jgi:hypothetical protein
MPRIDEKNTQKMNFWDENGKKRAKKKAINGTKPIKVAIIVSEYGRCFLFFNNFNIKVSTKS